VTLVAVKYANSLTAQREYEKHVAEHHGTGLEQARKTLKEAKDVLEELPAHTTSNISDIGLFGESAAKEIWAKNEEKRLDVEANNLKTSARTIDAFLIQLSQDIPGHENALKEATRKLSELEIDAEATANDKTVAEEAVVSERVALDRMNDSRREMEEKRENQKKIHDRLESELEKVHVLGK
jgi:chromosome segregation ATPase